MKLPSGSESYALRDASKIPPDSDPESEDDIPLDRPREDLDLAYELKTLSKNSTKPSAITDSLLRDGSGSNGSDQDVVPSGNKRRYSVSTTHEFMLYTPDEEQAVTRKLDRRLVLFVAGLYLLSFLDRSNIGNARIAGLSQDLKLSSSQYEWLLTAFYITYILFEWMTLLYRLIPPHIYIAVCVASWGLIASLQSVTNSFSAMLILRALLGVSEAAFGPGVPFYLSFFYKRDELALRTGLFISAAPLATSFASSLAWVITKAGKRNQISPWRMLFLLEGFPSMVVAVFAWYWIPDSPETARYLIQREKEVAKVRLGIEKEHESDGGKGKGLNIKEILTTLVDPKCYFTAAMFFSCNVAFSSLPVFLPTILEEMGYSDLAAHGLSAPPYLLAFLVVLGTASLSDRFRSRSTFVCFHALLGALGYSIIAIAGWRRASSTWRYIGIFPAAAGFFSAISIIITWTINNQDSSSKKGTGVAMLNIIGQLGPLVGTKLYPDSDKPFYVRGMSICAAFMLAVCLLSWSLRIVLQRENSRRNVLHSTPTDGDGEGLVSRTEKVNRYQQFRYML